MKRRLTIIFILLIFISSLCLYNFPILANEIVKADKIYTYEEMIEDITGLKEKYPNIISYKSIGSTHYRRDIYAIKLGTATPSVMIDAALHAREWITTYLCMNMIEAYAEAYVNNEMFAGYNVRKCLDRISIWFIPMVNPDGVTLQQKGLTVFPEKVHRLLLKMNNGKYDFSAWKADARGIDLNRQYPVDWKNKTIKVNRPYYKNYTGQTPLESVESRHLVRFIESVKPEILINYHSSGRVIYWYTSFATKEVRKLSREIARAYSDFSGYKIIPPSSCEGAVGLLSYFTSRNNRPSITPELGKYVGPRNVPLSEFAEIWRRNKKAGLYIAEKGYKIWERDRGEVSNILPNNHVLNYRMSYGISVPY